MKKTDLRDTLIFIAMGIIALTIKALLITNLN
jgi:hypothetical protein